MRKTFAERKDTIHWKQGSPSKKIIDRLLKTDTLLLVVNQQILAVRRHEFGNFVAKYSPMNSLLTEPTIPFVSEGTIARASMWAIVSESVTPFDQWYESAFK